MAELLKIVRSETHGFIWSMMKTWRKLWVLQIVRAQRIKWSTLWRLFEDLNTWSWPERIRLLWLVSALPNLELDKILGRPCYFRKYFTQSDEKNLYYSVYKTNIDCLIRDTVKMIGPRWCQNHDYALSFASGIVMVLTSPWAYNFHCAPN